MGWGRAPVDDQEQAGGDDEASRPNCGKVRAARRPFGAFSVATSAAPDHFPTDREALRQAQGQQQDGARTPTVVGRQQADEERGNAHRQQADRVIVQQVT